MGVLECTALDCLTDVFNTQYIILSLFTDVVCSAANTFPPIKFDVVSLLVFLPQTCKAFLLLSCLNKTFLLPYSVSFILAFHLHRTYVFAFSFLHHGRVRQDLTCLVMDLFSLLSSSSLLCALCHTVFASFYCFFITFGVRLKRYSYLIN